MKPRTEAEFNAVCRSLARKGLIECRVGPDGKVITRVGKSGRPQTVWFITEAGKKICEDGALMPGDSRVGLDS
jgi:hypothetical protein